jgi:hypothetical protein
MSFIQIELGGKLRGLKFNQLAIEIIGQHNTTNTGTGFIYAMFYGGLRGNSYVKSEEPDYNFEQVCDWIDEMENKTEAIEKVTKVMTDTQIWKSLVKTGEEVVGKEEKKKVSKSSASTI